MESSFQLAKRFHELVFDGKWIAVTNYKDQIIDLDWQLAITQYGSLNSIALLTFHINYYVSGILNVFNGGELEIKDKFSFDMNPIQSENDWSILLEEFWTNSHSLVKKIEESNDLQLEQIFAKKEYGNYRRNIEAMIEHGYYHLGQIVLINKLIKDS